MGSDVLSARPRVGPRSHGVGLGDSYVDYRMPGYVCGGQTVRPLATAPVVRGPAQSRRNRHTLGGIVFRIGYSCAGRWLDCSTACAGSALSRDAGGKLVRGLAVDLPKSGAQPGCRPPRVYGWDGRPDPGPALARSL